MSSTLSRPYFESNSFINSSNSVKEYSCGQEPGIKPSFCSNLIPCSLVIFFSPTHPFKFFFSVIIYYFTLFLFFLLTNKKNVTPNKVAITTPIPIIIPQR